MSKRAKINMLMIDGVTLAADTDVGDENALPDQPLGALARRLAARRRPGPRAARRQRRRRRRRRRARRQRPPDVAQARRLHRRGDRRAVGQHRQRAVAGEHGVARHAAVLRAPRADVHRAQNDHCARRPAGARQELSSARKLNRYLRWAGCESAIFNIGSYRRKLLGNYHSHDFFRPDNPSGTAARDQLFHAAMDDVIDFLATKGTAALLDGTNSTRKRRQQIVERAEAAAGRVDAKVIFLELLCNDPAIIEANILLKTKGPDYKDVPVAEALADFRARLAHYEDAYETVDEADQSYIKVFDVGQQIVTNNVRGYLPTKIVFYLMNMHILPRDILLVRAGQTTYSAEGRIGGDSLLNSSGVEFRANLHTFIRQYFRDEPDALAYLTEGERRTSAAAASAVSATATSSKKTSTSMRRRRRRRWATAT
jgi:6-phosphofructo-2-kinase/fructose-2,6-biphosphatase